MSIEVSGLNFKYKSRIILKDISFKAEKGDLLCVLGPNGVGKSTLFKCILGLLKNYQGEIIIDKKNLRKISRKEMAKQVAYIPQSHYPTFNFTVLNTVLMGMTVHLGGVSSPKLEDEKVAIETLEKLGIDHLANRGYAEISGGERQLALIARAIVQRAKVLIMDEPTANLDYGNQIRVMEQIKSLTNRGYTIILSTHNPEHAFLYGNKVMVMLDGRIISFGSPREELSEDLLNTVYGVKVNLHDIYSNEKSVRVCVPSLNN
ncbi:ABC transporter ATP-binding protein [Clostridium cylindrosporum]|uniref:ABC-type cobalamin/Fe3+-siderophores transport system, ATPase component n=1 Tax=Clostridium cylindrosporum DSM 605 TaxID=1121307 RepID=A0A0J8DBW1_CLOCY|nr:ABC transporter ATP-binding protein [Clostridium cylindrosporum]KMT21794.1 ABC-type cobalamin/Fe3+-siderophores transport system, ATPase component [Clostridium cylindrosporum DSM 605]